MTDRQCFDTFADAMNAASEGSRSPDEEFSASSSGDHIIGIHYDGRGLTGSSFAVVGADCSGGYLNVSNSWNNRVSSTWNGCRAIRHFDGFNLIGTSETTFTPGGDLSYMDNRTSSIQYNP